MNLSWTSTVAGARVGSSRPRLARPPVLRTLRSSPEFAVLQPSAISNGVLRISVAYAAYGSTNGNGRPRRSNQKSEDGYSSELLTEQPDNAKGQNNEGYVRKDFGAENVLESSSRRGGKKIASKSGDAHHKRPAGENRGEDPYRILDNGQKVYLDELDVITLLEPPKFLRPLKPVFYNHAAFLWKKIGDIPHERRHRLVDLLLPRHITKMWELSNLRYDDPDLFEEDPASMLPKPKGHPGTPVVWDGRVIDGGKFLSRLSDVLAPLYFQVVRADSVMATEEPCDLVLEYGSGHLQLRGSIPTGFPNPVKPLPPFNDKCCDYLRAVGPGVMVGQTWVEGRKLEQFPRRLFGEFILVRRFH